MAMCSTTLHQGRSEFNIRDYISGRGSCGSGVMCCSEDHGCSTKARPIEKVLCLVAPIDK